MYLYHELDVEKYWDVYIGQTSKRYKRYKTTIQDKILPYVYHVVQAEAG